MTCRSRSPPGFKAVRGVLILGVTLADLQLFAAEKRSRIEIGGEAPLEVVEERRIAGEQAGFEQAGLYRDVGMGFGDALVDRADRRSDLEPDIPKEADKRLHVRGEHLRVGVRVEQENVDVRVRVQFAAPVAAHGDERETIGHFALVPRVAHGLIDRLA